MQINDQLTTEKENHYRYSVKKIIKKEFNPYTFKNDVALIKLKINKYYSDKINILITNQTDIIINEKHYYFPYYVRLPYSSVYIPKGKLFFFLFYLILCKI